MDLNTEPSLQFWTWQILEILRVNVHSDQHTENLVLKELELD